MNALILICSLVSGADAPPAKPAATAAEKNSRATEKEAIKGAIAVDSSTADGGTAAAPEGPDVSKLPFTPATVNRVVAYWLPKVQACYEETLAAKNKDVAGVLMAKWIVSPDGIVKKAEILKKKTTLKDPHLHDCVITVISSMTFPKTPTGKEQPIEFPFNLKAVH